MCPAILPGDRKGFHNPLVRKSDPLTYEDLILILLVSGKARSAHGRDCRGCLVSRKARSAHGRDCRGCLVSRRARSAHGTIDIIF